MFGVLVLATALGPASASAVEPSAHLLGLTQGRADRVRLTLPPPVAGGLVPGLGLKLSLDRSVQGVGAGGSWPRALQAMLDQDEPDSISVPEAYVEWNLPRTLPVLKGLTVKAGKFWSLLGAEWDESYGHEDVGQSFLFRFALPPAYAGVLASRQLTEKLSLTGGMVRGWNEAGGGNEAVAGLASVSYALSDRITLTGNGLCEPEQARGMGPKRTVADLIATIRPAPPLTLVLNYDWGQEEQRTAGGQRAVWQGFAAIASYAFSDRASAGVRIQWFQDGRGVRTGLPQTRWETAATARYAITPHLDGRVAYRQERSSAGAFGGDRADLLRTQRVVGFDLSYAFD